MIPIIIPHWPLKEPLSPAIQRVLDTFPDVIVDGLSPHDRSRGLCASRALSEYPEAPGYLWIDDDMSPSIEQLEALERLFFDELEGVGDVATVSGCYICRHSIEYSDAIVPSFNPILAEGEERTIVFAEEGEVVEVHAHGMGFTIVNVQTLLDMKVPPARYSSFAEENQYVGRAWFLPEVVGFDHLGEDRSFCHRIAAQKLGRMLVDTRLLVPHGGYTLGKPA